MEPSSKIGKVIIIIDAIGSSVENPVRLLTLVFG